MANQNLDQLRTMCLSYTRASEKATWGHPTFRVGDKIFVGVDIGDPDGSVTSITLKSTDDEQRALLAEGVPYFFPAYVGVKGWIGVQLIDPVDWNVVSEFIEDSYRLVAPQKLVAKLDN